MMRLLISFIFGALGAVIMYNIKSNFSFPVTTIVLVVFVAACLHFDLVKRKRSKIRMIKSMGLYGGSQQFSWF